MTDLEGSQDLFWHMRFERRAGGEGVQRSIDYPYIVWLRFSASFFKVYKKVSCNHSHLSAYKSETIIFGLTEIQDNRFICFHRAIS